MKYNIAEGSQEASPSLFATHAVEMKNEERKQFLFTQAFCLNFPKNKCKMYMSVTSKIQTMFYCYSHVGVDDGIHAPPAPLSIGHSDSELDSTQEDK